MLRAVVVIGLLAVVVLLIAGILPYVQPHLGMTGFPTPRQLERQADRVLTRESYRVVMESCENNMWGEEPVECQVTYYAETGRLAGTATHTFHAIQSLQTCDGEYYYLDGVAYFNGCMRNRLAIPWTKVLDMPPTFDPRQLVQLAHATMTVSNGLVAFKPYVIQTGIVEGRACYTVLRESHPQTIKVANGVMSMATFRRAAYEQATGRPMESWFLLESVLKTIPAQTNESTFLIAHQQYAYPEAPLTLSVPAEIFRAPVEPWETIQAEFEENSKRLNRLRHKDDHGKTGRGREGTGWEVERA